MNYIEFPNKGRKCFSCPSMFIVYTPSGADYITCPICGCDDEDDMPYDFEGEEDYDYEGYIYCRKCKIVYTMSCTHAYNGCTDDTYYAKLVDSFVYDGVEYKGIPTFEKMSEFYKNKDKYKFNWICTSKGGRLECPRAFYRKDHNNYKCYHSRNL